jgi:uncharacterized protein YjbI with pentapeptide repeats
VQADFARREGELRNDRERTETVLLARVSDANQASANAKEEYARSRRELESRIGRQGRSIRMFAVALFSTLMLLAAGAAWTFYITNGLFSPVPIEGRAYGNLISTTASSDQKLAAIAVALRLNVPMSRAVLPNLDLRRFDLNGVSLAGADLRAVLLSGVRLSGTDLSQANLAGADLSRADLRGVNLTGANLTGANLTGANLTGANLTKANLLDADLTGANRTGADLSGANVAGARFDHKPPVGSP